MFIQEHFYLDLSPSSASSAKENPVKTAKPFCVSFFHSLDSWGELPINGSNKNGRSDG
jgi:hypothetical protein